MTWLWIVLGVLVLLLIALFGAAWYFFQVSIVRAEKEKTEDEFYEGDDSIWKPFRESMEKSQKWLQENTTEHVHILSFDGLKLSALYVPSDLEKPRGTCIVFHGYRSLATVDFAPEAEFLHSLGYRLLMPYQRSHGESEGRYISYGINERYDCRDWAKYITGRFPGEDIFLMGISMGSATVMMASDLELPETVKGVVADCGFTSPWEIMAHVAKKDYNLPSFPLLNMVNLLARAKGHFGLKDADSRISLSRTKLPFLFIHGEDDDFVPVYMTNENFAACKSEKELYMVKGAGHAQAFAIDPKGCEEKIQAFFEKHATL